MRPTYADKVIELETACAAREALRGTNETLVHCHGCFDIVHPGHVHHLRFAAEQGNRLIVTVTPDRYVDKGPGRPMFNERLRAENLAALEFVDWVVINDAPTASSLLEQLRPDVYIKGAEYRHKNDVRFEEERSIVECHGGRVVFSDDQVVYSSTAIIESIRSVSDTPEPNGALVSLSQRHDLTSRAVAETLNASRGKRVLVLSESILDVYAHCKLPEIAQEHPMLSLHPEREETFDGGGAVIAKHLAAMGADVTLCTPLGSDVVSSALIERLRLEGVRVERIAYEAPPPIKLRYLVDGEKMMKIDSSARYLLPDDAGAHIQQHIEAVGGYDALVIADFGLGLFSNRLASSVIDAARPHVGMILGDVSGRRAQLSEMRGADLLCPCEIELRQMLGADETPLSDLAHKAMSDTRVETLCVTRADEGLVLYDRHSGVCTLPALCSNPVDVLGCGDALLAAMTASLLGGADWVQAGFIGSLAAAIEGEANGNVTVHAEQIISRAQQLGAGLLASSTVEPTWKLAANQYPGHEPATNR